MGKLLGIDLFQSRRDRRRASRRSLAARGFRLEPLEDRTTPAIVAAFSPAAGVLSVFGDALGNAITVSRNAAGTLSVNGGAVAILGGTATVANTKLIQVFGQAGNDAVALDEANGTLPRANLFGGAGNDTLAGGSGADQLFGEAGNDTLLGKAGADVLFGGAGDDVLTGGRDFDQVFGQAGNDRMIWNPGDGSALNEGGAGSDTVEVIGGNVGENFTVAANGSRVRFDRVSPAPFFLDIGTSENLVVSAAGGDDTITAGNGLANLIQITMDGGAGNDTLNGGDGNDRLIGGDGNDVIDGNQGTDQALMGAGDDVFRWDPGDGSDTVEGQDGRDVMVFNGSNQDENVAISANGRRVRFTRDPGAVTMDLGGVEQVDFNALGGKDHVTVNDLTGTDLTALNLNLGATVGGGAGDGQADTVEVNGTGGNDSINVVGEGTSFSVTGLQAVVRVTNSEGANDALVVRGLGGDDGLGAFSLLSPDVIKALTLDGGAGNDNIIGGPGSDTLIGGDGNDFIVGVQGNDVAMMGAGDDTFIWNPGDGSDLVEGQDGNDKLIFVGSEQDESIDVSANGSRARLTRDVGHVTMDLGGVEAIEVRARTGADTLTVNDLAGTDVTRVDLDLTGARGAGDGGADRVIVRGTDGDDAIAITGDAAGVSVLGLAAQVNLVGAEAANDRLTVSTLAGDDAVDASGLSAGAIPLSVDGGAGDDLLVGGDGDDTLSGGDGDDVLAGGPGHDVLDGGPGDNTLIQD